MSAHNPEDGSEYATGPHVCGWNGSRSLYRPTHMAPGTTPSAEHAARLAQIRAQLVKQAAGRRRA